MTSLSLAVVVGVVVVVGVSLVVVVVVVMFKLLHLAEIRTFMSAFYFCIWERFESVRYW